MNGWKAAMAVLGVTITATTYAGAPALTPDALARCASQVQSLREESSRLNQLNARYDGTRKLIDNRSAALQTERDALDPDDLAKGLDFRQRMQRHTDETIAFNAEIEQLKRDVSAIGALRTEYDQNCAQRPYRRADLDALPEAARNAMRAGLAGVQVPYLDPAVAPVAP